MSDGKQNYPFDLKEDDHFTMISKYFEENGPVSLQFEGYEYMVNHTFQKIIDDCPSIEITNKTSFYKATFGQIHYEKASIVNDKTVVHLTPNEARMRDLTYDSPVYVDVTEEFWEKGEKINILQHKVLLCRVPTMVRSSRCNLYGLSNEECIALGECENDPGGHFIINGKERALIFQERLNYNQIYGFSSNLDKFPYIAEIRSMSEETGHSALLKAMVDKDNRNCCFSLPYMSKEVLAGTVFKALGFTNEDIIRMISPETRDEQKLTERLIRESIKYNTREKAIKYISKSSAHKVEDNEERRIHYTEQVIENELFPHMGISSNLEKAMMLGTMINKLFRICLGKRPQDDRDNVALKRIEGPGVLISDLFRMCLKRYCDNLKKYLEKRQDILTAVTRTNSITAAIKHAFSTGNWTAQKNTYVRTGVSQIMSRLSYPATISHLRRIVIPVGKEGKNIKIRQIHPSQSFFIDIIESPEGKGIGVIKNFALLGKVTVGCNPILVRQLVETCPLFESVETFLSSVDACKQTPSFIYINGTLIGWTKELQSFYRELLKMKYEQLLFSDQVSISIEEEEHEIRIFCDHGRLLRGLLRVEDNKIVLNKDDLQFSWLEYIEKDMIRFIDCNEVEQSLIAMFPADLIKYSDKTYHYCELHPTAMLGAVSSVIPFGEHCQNPRLVYESSMMKQALGIYALSYRQRFDTITHVMQYPQRPMVDTKYNKMFHYDEMLTGVNPIVAISCYTGFNQEDSVILNKASIDRGMFVTTAYRTIIFEEKKKTNCSFEKIEVPPLKYQNKTLNYSKLGPNGIVRKGVPVYKGDVLVGKTLTKVNKDEEDKTDCSLCVAHGEDGIIDDIWSGLGEEGYTMIKIKIRQLRTPEVGDKFACYDETSSVLTSVGWKNISLITKTDKVATLQDGEIIYEHPLQLFEYDYDGDMYHIASQQVDVFVTPNHRLYVKKRNATQFTLEKASDMFGKRVSYKKNGEWKADKVSTFQVKSFDSPFLTNDWCMFLGIWYAEGWASGKETYGSVCISANKQRVRDHLFVALSNMNIPFHYNENTHKVNIYNTGLYNELKPFSVGSPFKTLPSYVWDFSMEECMILLKGMLLGDGSQTNTQSWSYWTSSFALAEDVQRLVFHCGWSANIILYPGRVAGTKNIMKDGRVVKSNYNNYRVAIVVSKNEPTVNHGHVHSQHAQVEEWLPYKGKVYCVEVPSNILYMKRNGKPYWCGNSRSSQKGVCGLLLEQENMPFTSQGITPDLMMNPHCFTGETLVTLCNGLSVPISNLSIHGGENVWGHNKEEKGGMTIRTSLSMGCGGIKPLVKLTFQDGRTIRCTPGHQFYTTDGRWITAEDIQLDKDTIQMSLEGVVDCIGKDEKDWKLVIECDVDKTFHHTFSMDTKEEREKTLAFSRIIGYLLADGCINKSKDKALHCPIYLGTLLDATLLQKDVFLLSGKQPTIQKNDSSTGFGNVFVINLPSIITQWIGKLDGITIGKRTQQETFWPSFLATSPKAVIREFLAGIFGGDGHAPSLVGEHVSEIRFGQTANTTFETHFTNKMLQLCDLLNQFGVNAVIERKRWYHRSEPGKFIKLPEQYDPNEYMTTIYIIVKNGLAFMEKIGMRYCVEKMNRLAIVRSYKKLQERVREQSLNIFDEIEKYMEKGYTIKRSIELARENFLSTSIPLNAYYTLGISAKTQVSNRRKVKRNRDVRHFNYNYFPTFKQYLVDIGCIEWFSTQTYMIDRTQMEMPTFSMKVIGRQPDGEAPIYCINVKDVNNFLACGVVVKNSQPSRMTLSQLMECLYSKVGTMDGIFGDGTAFTEQSINPVETIANMLKKHGFQKYGNERLYSGFTGEMMDADIFIGPTYYQRLKHLVADKIHCLTTDHDVLTIDGWKPITAITLEDRVATLDSYDSLVYDYPTEIHDYPHYKGSMYYVKSETVDLAVTGNHRMWVCEEGSTFYDFKKASEVRGKNVMYKKNTFWNSESYTIVDMNEMMEMDLFPDSIMLASRNCIQNILEMLFMEGEIYFMSHERSNQLQQLCFHANYSYTVHSCINGIDSIIVWFEPFALEWIKAADERWVEEEEQHVVCITVPNQVFYVRRNGKPVWTGNSRATGNVTMMHHQPSEGRSREGGLRTGEMERDALISHGGAAFIQETMFDMSDQYQVNVCEKCGNILSSAIGCRMCKNGNINRTNIPYCAKLLFQELEAMGIKIQIHTK